MNYSNRILYLPLILLIILFGFTTASAQKITGLDGFTLFIDQGHSMKENSGVFGYSEAEKSLRVGLELQRLLMEYTDIDTAYVARTSDTIEVTLTQRTDLANALDADFYYSIHSDAAESATVNSTLFLHGGWRSNGETVEKTPEGGKDFGDILNPILTDAMQTNTRGNYADRTFYQGTPDHHDNQFPYLHVNRESNMASLLSEAGFHTTPYQNQRNMNADYKRLEARAAFWAVLEYMGADRPVEGILAGEIADYDLDRFAKGVTITVQDTSVVTDTYESLFHKYTSDPDLLSNGFFYIDGLTPGETEVIIGGDGYFSDTILVNIKETEITFLDTVIRNSHLPVVAHTEPVEGDTVVPGDPVVIHFSKKMDTTSVVERMGLEPDTEYDVVWKDLRTLELTTDLFEEDSLYTLIIEAGSMDEGGLLELDGNGDGEEGGDFIFHFRTAEPDTIPPLVAEVYPDSAVSGVEVIVGITFDKIIDHDSLPENLIILTTVNGEEISGEIRVDDVRGQSVISLFPEEDLAENSEYHIVLMPGYMDLKGNVAQDTLIFTFLTGGDVPDDEILVQDFEEGLAPFWQPSQSGSTVGIIAEETNAELTSSRTNLLSESTQAVQINYGFYEDQTGLIRFYSNTKTPTFHSSYTLQSYVFGDGSGNRMRLVVRDENNELEASGWKTIDWRGWRLVSWDMTEDEVFSFVGDGVVDGNAYFDSYQISYVSGQPNTGFMVFDDLKAVRAEVPTYTFDQDFPEGLALHQNFPNPSVNMTRIRYSIPEKGQVRLELTDLLGRHVKTLLSAEQMQGDHEVDVETASLASGVYFYRLHYENYVLTGKMMVTGNAR